MANSSIILEAKNKIIKEFIKDKDIIQAINSSSVEKSEELIGTHIFNYHQNPNTINTVGTFITVQVHVPEPYFDEEVYTNPTIEIWIISHEKHMVVDNIPKVLGNRNDYLSILIDKKLNGKSDFGIGKMKLKSNLEGAYQQNYLYRKLLFKCTDLNNSLCADE